MSLILPKPSCVCHVKHSFRNSQFGGHGTDTKLVYSPASYYHVGLFEKTWSLRFQEKCSVRVGSRSWLTFNIWHQHFSMNLQGIGRKFVHASALLDSMSGELRCFRQSIIWSVSVQEPFHVTPFCHGWPCWVGLLPSIVHWENALPTSFPASLN